MTNGSEDFQMGERFARIEGDIKVLREIAEHTQKTMSDFTSVIGKTVQDNDKGIVEIRTTLENHKWIFYLLGTGIVGAVVTSFF